AALYAFLAAFTLTVGGNMTQAHSIADAMQAGLGVPTLWTGAVTAAATAVVILGGIRSIARAASALVPTMIVIYCAA
ncbi:alanine:cation symporter family protein, partial [Methylobacterium crusticola]|uniref:alanine:cation symporter family protein n=1 Tax=Methylobacterium crusticola TaxID=1697972 RepID=UPI001EE33968